MALALEPGALFLLLCGQDAVQLGLESLVELLIGRSAFFTRYPLGFLAQFATCLGFGSKCLPLQAALRLE
ncbi:MAG: hypothetical protein CMO74_00595 [Verrucomicrobiales bacterium]|nr:hypothetical protein [Verrucomicrobiales bacterium]